MRSVLGGVPHPSGVEGITKDKLDAFVKDSAAHLEWHSRSAIPAGKKTTEIMPLGDETRAIYSVVSAVRGKLDQYFAQCDCL